MTVLLDWDQPALDGGEWDAHRVPVQVRDAPAPATAGDLVAQELCTPQCLLSCSPRCRLCACGCAGQYHGALASVSIGEVQTRAAQLTISPP